MKKYLLALLIVVLLVPASFGSLCFYSFYIVPWSSSDSAFDETPITYSWQTPTTVVETYHIHMVRELAPLVRIGAMKMPLGTTATGVVVPLQEVRSDEFTFYVTTKDTRVSYKFVMTGVQVTKPLSYEQLAHY